MINRKQNPVAYSAIQFELSDAIEHLKELTKNMHADAEYSDEEFAIELGHIYAHLNRSWNIRNRGDLELNIVEKEWGELSNFPSDIEICG